jgi:hypothetical protein
MQGHQLARCREKLKKIEAPSKGSDGPPDLKSAGGSKKPMSIERLSSGSRAFSGSLVAGGGGRPISQRSLLLHDLAPHPEFNLVSGFS